jgi:hypothetical protein
MEKTIEEFSLMGVTTLIINGNPNYKDVYLVVDTDEYEALKDDFLVGIEHTIKQLPITF